MTLTVSKRIVFMQSHTLRARRDLDSQRGHHFILPMKKMMLKKKVSWPGLHSW